MPTSCTSWAYPAPISLLALLLAAAPAVASESFGDAEYFVGDLHAHTGYSGDAGSADFGDCEGSCGTFADVFETAKDNGLDFVALTDHVNGGSAMTASEFVTLNAAVLAANDPTNGFVTLPAGEVWFTMRGTGARLGHKTLLLFGDDATLSTLSLADVRIGAGSGVDACEDIWSWMDTLSGDFGPTLLLPHHPSVRMPMETDWGCFDATYEPAVEIYSEHGNGLDDGDYDVPGEGIFSASTTVAAMDPDGYGLAFGFVGGTDSHDSKPGGVCDLDTEQPTHLYGGGLTVAVLPSSDTFDRDTLYDAIVSRRTYVTSGPLLPMAVQWSSAGTVLGGLGATIDAPASYDLDVSVSVPADRAHLVTAVQVVGPDATWSLLDDGAGNWTGSVPAGAVPPWLYAAVEIDGAAWYAPDGCNDGGDDTEWLWGSPSTITLWEDDSDSDGASVLEGDCDDGNPAVYPGAPEAWYDGVDQDCDAADDYDQDDDGDRALGWGRDCDDLDPSVHPGAPDAWYDGVDHDCNGADDYDRDADGQRAWGYGLDCDDGDPNVFSGAPEVWYDNVDQDCGADSDHDQDGDSEDAVGSGGMDCDDTDADAWPGAPEIWYDGVDQGCDGGSDYDRDGDGHDARQKGGADCDDTRADVSPDATDTWYDGVDQDCDGASDYDQDADGFDDALGGGADCDDTDADVSPIATEAWYDGVDQDCDGASDWDADGDGADADTWDGDDCDDTRADVSPAAIEVWYDGFDQDCDGASDYDRDGDGITIPLDCHDTNPDAWACRAVDAPPTGCAAVPGAGGAAGAIVLAGLLLSRRRRG